MIEFSVNHLSPLTCFWSPCASSSSALLYPALIIIMIIIITNTIIIPHLIISSISFLVLKIWKPESQLKGQWSIHTSRGQLSIRVRQPRAVMLVPCVAIIIINNIIIIIIIHLDVQAVQMLAQGDLLSCHVSHLGGPIERQLPGYSVL